MFKFLSDNILQLGLFYDRLPVKKQFFLSIHFLDAKLWFFSPKSYAGRFLLCRPLLDCHIKFALCKLNERVVNGIIHSWHLAISLIFAICSIDTDIKRHHDKQTHQLESKKHLQKRTPANCDSFWYLITWNKLRVCYNVPSLFVSLTGEQSSFYLERVNERREKAVQ